MPQPNRSKRTTASQPLPTNQSDPPRHPSPNRIRFTSASDPLPHQIHSCTRSAYPSDPHLHQICTNIRSSPSLDLHPHQIRMHIRSASPQIRTRIRSTPPSDPNTHQIRKHIRSTIPQTSCPCARRPVSTGDRMGLGFRRSASSPRRQSGSRRRGATGRVDPRAKVVGAVTGDPLPRHPLPAIDRPRLAPSRQQGNRPGGCAGVSRSRRTLRRRTLGPHRRRSEPGTDGAARRRVV
jgi:hypothetical protein